MKYSKTLVLVALSMAALLASTSIASATILTDAPVPIYTSVIKAESEGAITMHGVVTLTCNSTIEGSIEQHGNEITTGGSTTSLTFTECGSFDVTVKNGGSLEIHTRESSPNGNGTLTSTGMQFTVNVTPLGISCVYTTFETDIGTLTGSSATGGTAKVDLEGSIPRTGGSVYCGTSSGPLTGTYKITTPDYLDVD
ncbi:MAG TPA: hypothetical protein VIL21_09115 [Solirubrobacterales bacterium]|jgi:hypothetical protein